MKNINNLILTNFQQWKTGNVEFKPGLNIIIGDTESGKSTLFRAINSILTGKMPEDYIRKGTKGCEVEINFSDNTVFKRSRTKKDNIANANGLVFERVGKEIPFEYFNKLGKTSIEFGNKELSLCSYSQFEPHFFITLSDYDKSKLIGTICGINVVDKLMDSINKDIRNNNTNIKFLEQQITEQKIEKEVKVKEFEIVDKKQLQLMEYYNEIYSKFDTIKKLADLQIKINQINSDIDDTNKHKNILDNKISNFNIKNVELLTTLQNHKNNLQIYNTIEKRIKEDLSKLKTDSIDNKKSELLDKLSSLRDKLYSINNSITIYKESQEKDSIELTKLEKEKSELLKDFDRCPLCGGIL